MRHASSTCDFQAHSQDKGAAQYLNIVLASMEYGAFVGLMRAMRPVAMVLILAVLSCSTIPHLIQLFCYRV